MSADTRDPRSEDLPETLTIDDGVKPGAPEIVEDLAPGQVLGGRYRILEMLGRGGMGEVWRAFDLKLRVEVALKTLHPGKDGDSRRIEQMRREVRAAREVLSPNVCRIFGLEELDGRELVSMEYVDGSTLLEFLRQHAPLELTDAQDIASQFLAGLEAIHKAGLVHRDIKPENIMITRSGRVVVMDFGIARRETADGSTVSGTPAYMAPEQAAGQAVDSRADLYSAGVVLAELATPDGISDRDSRESIWEGLRSEPIQLPDSPWAQVIERSVATDPVQRYESAHSLTRALEDVTLRVKGADDLHPYPGLSSFTEEDAEYFFGREAEVEQMWRRFEGPPRMLALVGPSGAGKSSFIGAGLLAAAPPGWSFVVCNPGNAAISSLGRAMAGEMAGDKEAFEQMLEFDNPDVAVEVLARWRSRHDRALLVVDQFEELFTQNTPDEQHRFSELLNRLVLEADVFVVLSMRDDFLMRCRDQEALKPIFTDMTALPTLSGGALRRALVQPANTCGYRFEDDDLVDEMLAEIEDERGALPLLAFAAARLWEMRDRKTGLLTRQAYQDIGGVGGALARHAEATVDRIGSEHIGVVRELFRNLVTAEGTRAVREWNELLSVFGGVNDREGINPSPTMLSAPVKGVGAGFTPARESAEEVLRELIDARLLTSYEVREDEHEPIRRVEIIHESLLANWPRLVRWQTQDADAVQLRDQLRQAAKTWDDQGRTDSMLWTGPAFREYTVWRESYPGNLTANEEVYASAMTSYARRKVRHRRSTVAVAFVILLATLAVVGTLWKRSSRDARLAEASQLLTIGNTFLDSDPNRNCSTTVVAYALASLEHQDSTAGRRLALDALWRGGVGFGFEGRPRGIEFIEPDQLLAVDHLLEVHLFDRSGKPISTMTRDTTKWLPPNTKFRILPSQKLIGLWDSVRGAFDFWSYPNWKLARGVELGPRVHPLVTDSGTVYSIESGDGGVTAKIWPNDSDHPTNLGDAGLSYFTFDRGMPRAFHRDEMVCSFSGPEVWIHDLGRWGDPPILLGRHEYDVCWGGVSRDGRLVSTADEKGILKIWRINSPEATSPRVLKGPIQIRSIAFNDGAGLLAAAGRKSRTAPVWDLSGPPTASPWLYGGGTAGGLGNVKLSSDGAWLTTGSIPPTEAFLFPVKSGRPYILAEGLEFHGPPLFLPDGSHVVAALSDGTIRSWPLSPEYGTESKILFRTSRTQPTSELAVHPSGEHLLASGTGGVWLVPSDGRAATQLRPPSGGISGAAFSASGRYAAAAGTDPDHGTTRLLWIWDLETGTSRVAGELTDPLAWVWEIRFSPDARQLYAATMGGLFAVNLVDGSSSFIGPEGVSIAISPNGDLLYTAGSTKIPGRRAGFYDLSSGQYTHLETHADADSIAVNSSGTVVVTGSNDGTIRAGSTDGSPPHVLLGHRQSAHISISPDGRWIASIGRTDGSLRLWPMPDVRSPVLTTLPHDKLIAKLKTLTNLRVVRDEESATGWRTEFGPFPGWAEVPEW